MFRFLFPTIVICLLGQQTAAAQGLDIAIIGADNNGAQLDLEANLLGTGRFNSITVIDGLSVTPSLVTLQTYDAIVTWSNSDYNDSTTLGNNLADYVDEGGGVVVMVFSTTSAGVRRTLQGRWATEDYFIMEPVSGTTTTASSLGVRYDPSHPILDGVNSFDGGSRAFRGTSTSFAPGTSIVADWTDGIPLILINESHAAARVDLNFFPQSNNLNSTYWDTNTDGATLIANALEWTAGGSLPVLSFAQMIPGEFLTVNVERLTPGNATVTVISVRGPGPTPSPFGDILATRPWFQTPQFPADENGVVNFTSTLPAGASGHTLYCQTLEFIGDGTAELSNPLAVLVP